MRTTNALERVNLELRRRTRVASLFPNEASLLRLVTALLAETSQEWETGKTYLNMDNQNPALSSNAEAIYRKILAPPYPAGKASPGPLALPCPQPDGIAGEDNLQPQPLTVRLT